MGRPQPNPFGGARAFTLVELLVVMLIIGLLAAILTPTIASILQQGYLAKSTARADSLSQGADQYRHDTGDYPGQAKPDEFLTGSDYDYTGSQVLAAHLFGLYDEEDSNPYAVFDDGVIPEDNPEKGLYAPLGEDILQTVYDVSDTPVYLTIVDCFPKAHPVAYYMSHPVPGVEQYQLDQNAAYTGDQQSTQDRFELMITDPRFADDYFEDPPAIRDGMFLLISPGADGDWFGEDDVRNWQEKS